MRKAHSHLGAMAKDRKYLNPSVCFVLVPSSLIGGGGQKCTLHFWGSILRHGRGGGAGGETCQTCATPFPPQIFDVAHSPCSAVAGLSFQSCCCHGLMVGNCSSPFALVTPKGLARGSVANSTTWPWGFRILAEGRARSKP